MGNHEVVASKIESLRSEEWVEAGEDQENAMFSNVNPYRRRLLAHVLTQELIEEYELNFITEEDYNSYVNELSYRQATPTNNYTSSENLQGNGFIYPIRYFLNKSKQEMCTTVHTGYLYADKVELRLKEINDIPFQDLLYMYKATLNGFKTLYEKVGYFDIVQEMVFITKTGHVKIWMNANLAKNYPNYQKSSALSSTTDPQQSNRLGQNIYGSQAEMTRKLILMIEKNSDEFADPDSHQQHQLFSQFLEDKNLFDRLSFQHCLDEFQNYLCQNNLHCPNYMKSIPELFSPDEFPHNAVPNYEQSHVNQITSQHLTQIKKRFQPMETIVEDNNLNNKSTNKHQNFNKNNNFHESLVAKYTTPHSFSTAKQHESGFKQQNKVIRPGYMPFNDLNHSRASHQPKSNEQNGYAHLQQSNNYNSVNGQHIHKPNSVSAVNYRPNNQTNFSKNQQILNVHPHSLINFQQQTNSNMMANQPQHFMHLNQTNQRLMMVSPPPSFRPMGEVGNNIIYHPGTFQPINLPVMIQTPMHRSQASNRQGENYQKQTNRASNMELQNNHYSARKEFVNSHSNTQNFNHGNNLSQTPLHQTPKNYTPLLKKQSSLKQQSLIRKVESMEDAATSKSKIKYFTKNDAYHLDEEIANDLQKFLGLKVN